MQTPEINIGSICGGAVPEVFDKAVEQVLSNIVDINYPAEAPREITLKIKFKASESREVGEVSFNVTTKLPSVKPAKGNFFLAKRMGGVRGYCRDPKQEEMFRNEPPAVPQPQ